MEQKPLKSRRPGAGRFVTGLDLGLLIFFLVVSGIGFFYQSVFQDQADYGIVRYWDGREELIDLSLDREWEIEGKLGTLHIQTAQGELRVVEADCPDQICVNSGPLPTKTLAIICVPNGIIIEARGEKGEYDAVTW